MKTVIYRDRRYEFVDINSKDGNFYQATFAKYAHGKGRSLMDVYERPSIAKQEAWQRLNLIHDFVTVTSYSCHFLPPWPRTEESMLYLFIPVGTATW